MNKAIVYSQNNCAACVTAKQLLAQAGFTVDERNISGPMYSKQDLFDRAPGVRSVPQIFIEDKHFSTVPELKAFLVNVNV